MTDLSGYGAQYNDSGSPPWRCIACGVAVRKGQNDPCNCTRFPLGAKVVMPGGRYGKVVAHGRDHSGFYVEVQHIALVQPTRRTRHPASTLALVKS